MKPVILLSLFAAALPAFAQETSPSRWTVTGAVDVVNDYRFRGVSQTNNDPALQGTLSANYGGFSATVWASNVEGFADSEIDLTLSQSWDTGDDSFSVGGIYYAYPGEDDLNYAEVYGTWNRDFDGTTLGSAVYVSPDFFAGSGTAIYAQISADHALTDQWSAGARFRRQWIDANALAGLPDYNTWAVSIAWSHSPLTLALSYEDTDIAQGLCAGPCESGLIGRISIAY